MMCVYDKDNMSALQIKNTSEVRLYYLTAVHSYDLYHIDIMSFSSYNGCKLNSHLTCFQQGFIAQLLEHRTGIVEVMGSNPVGADNFFLGFICYFITSRIIFTCRIWNIIESLPCPLMWLVARSEGRPGPK